jgi:hypothetical protein
MTVIHILRTTAMSQFKTAILTVAALAGVATAVLQHRAAQTLRAENSALLEQNKNLAQLQADNERLSNLLSQARANARGRDQNAELLRLRGQVGLLRDKLQKSLAAGHATPVNPNAAPSQNDAADDAAQPFTAALTARLENRQTLLVGGWSTTPGMRTFVLMTPNIAPAEGSSTQTATDGSTFQMPNAKVSFNTCTINVPDTMLSQYGFDQFRADGHDSSVQSVFAASDADALLNALKAPPAGVFVSHGQITTADGIASTMSVSADGNSPSDGQPASPDYSIGLTPNLTDNQTAMNLKVNVKVVGAANRQ